MTLSDTSTAVRGMPGRGGGPDPQSARWESLERDAAERMRAARSGVPLAQWLYTTVIAVLAGMSLHRYIPPIRPLPRRCSRSRDQRPP